MSERKASLVTILGEVGTSPKSGETPDSFKSYLSRRIEQYLDDGFRLAATVHNGKYTVSAFSRKEWFKEITSTLFLLGRVEKAEEIIEELEEESNIDIDDLYRHIALEQAKAGKFDEARKTVEANLAGYDKGRTYLDILNEQIRRKDFDEARRTLDDLGGVSAYDAISSYKKVASAQAQAGMHEEARKTLESVLLAMENRKHIYETPVEFYSQKAVVQVLLGRKEEARELIRLALEKAEEITGENKRDTKKRKSKAYLLIAPAQAQAGMYDEAIETANRIINKASRFNIYRTIACMQAQAGMYDEAIETIEKIESEKDKQDGYRVVSDTLTEMGKFPESTRIAKKLTDEFWRSYSLLKIVSAQAERQLLDEALETAGMIDSERYCKSEAYSKIASAQAKAGLFDEAKESMSGIAYDRDEVKFDAYVELASAQAKSKNYSEAKNNIKSAREILGMMRDTEKPKLYSKLALACHNLLQKLDAA